MELKEAYVEPKDIPHIIHISVHSPHNENGITGINPSNTNQDPEQNTSSLPKNSKQKTKVGPLKEISVTTNTIITVGNPWNVLQFASNLKPTLYYLFAKFNEDKCRLILHLIIFFSTFSSIALSIVTAIFAKKDNEAIVFGVLIFGVFSQLCTLGYLIYIIIITCLNKILTREHISFVFCVRTGNFLIGIFLGLTVCEYKLSFGYIMLVLTYCSYFDCVTGFMLLVIFLILIFIGLVFEAIIRLCMCKLTYPSQSLVSLRYQYQIFSYDTNSFGKNECVICLGDFVKNDEIVLLSCHYLHIFHEKCMIEWIQRSCVCPVCRTEISFLID